MTRLQEVVKVFDEFFKVSTVVELKETMVFKCDENGNVFNIEYPVHEEHHVNEFDARLQHENLVNMYNRVESEGFTMDKWNGSIENCIEELDWVHEDVIDQLVNALPPRTWTKYKMQPGERHSHEGYMTFKKEFGLWYYAGIEN
ncbi:MAG: hypothetical protein ACRC1P_09870 [Cellulosilyticaceae bacterium]